MKDIKILATLGPSSTNKSIVEKMDSSGVDIFRINLSHTKIEDLEGIINNVASWTKKPICIDTEGAQIRTGKMKSEDIILKNNSIVNLVSSDVLGDESNIPLYPIVPKDVLKEGDIIAIDFNFVTVQVIEIKEEKVLARVLSGGKIGNNKGVDVDRSIDLEAFTEKDLKAFELCFNMGLSYISLSFSAKRKDIEKLRSIFKYPITVISKIESRDGLANLKEICLASDAILIDRGDLSRQVAMQKIAFAQKHIIDVAKETETPVYVATNLLESMIANFYPTRAEINDITSTLFSGAEGLVLAAETAIGKYPIQSVRMVDGVRKEFNDYIKGKDYFNYIYDYNLIEPHGGILVQNFISQEEFDKLKNCKSIIVDERILSDIVQISEGTYSPLRGFMNKKELNSVLDYYKLPNGIVWTLPILFQIKKEDIKFNKNETIIIKGNDNNPYAIMKVSDIENIDLVDVAKRWFSVDDLKHPGVARFIGQGDYIVSGEVFLLKKPDLYLNSYSLSPRQTRQIFKNQNWQKIVGFHTRNVIHRGHEYIQKKALDLVGADALFINPVVGPKKINDFSSKAILESYEVMLRNNYYSPYSALMASFNTFSRYSGPREAVFTALCRKNFGCSHFIIGRDHTGVGNYYTPNASQIIFEKIGDIGIKPIIFNSVYFCKECNEYTDNCPHKEEGRLKISGTQMREQLLNGLEVPEYLMRKDIFQSLKNIPKNELFIS